jgi:MFS family permease
LLGALYSLLQFIVAPIWGRLSDRFGRRPILLISLGGNLVAYLLWVFSGTFALLLLSRLMAGIMGGSVASANAAVADITGSAKERARGMGLVGMAFGLGFILGPVIGGVSYYALPRLDDNAALAAIGVNPFSMPAAIATALCLINFIWAIMRFRETLPLERRQKASAATDRTANPFRLFSNRLGAGVLTVNLAFFFHTVLFAGMESTLVFLTAQMLGFEPQHNGYLFAWMGFLAAVMQGGVFRRMAPRIGGKPLAIAGLLLLMPGFLLIGLVDWHHHTWLLVLGISVLATGTGLVFPALSTLISLAASRSDQGLALGSFRSAGSLGRAIGPLLAAVVYFTFRPAAPYLCGMVGVIIPILLLMSFRPVTVSASDG